MKIYTKAIRLYAYGDLQLEGESKPRPVFLSKWLIGVAGVNQNRTLVLLFLGLPQSYLGRLCGPLFFQN